MSNRTLFIEPFSGLSGDMFLGALAGLCNAYSELEALPDKLHLPDGKVVIEKVSKNGIVCQHVEVIDTGTQHHHHDDSDHHHSPHRHLPEILDIIDKADIPDGAKTIARSIFNHIGKAESSVHDMPLESIHFHEISGVDSIIDIVGSALLIDRLGVVKCYSSPVCTGRGMVQTQHGRLPVPAPATTLLLHGMPQYAGNEDGERTTPTGAAILRYLNPEFNEVILTPIQVAYGPGKKDFIASNVLKISICKGSIDQSKMQVLETNIDDMPSEFFGLDFQDGLFEAGATDVYFTPIQMKKGRPAIKLTCFTSNENLKPVTNYLLDQTTSIGVRHYEANKFTLQRESRTEATPYGEVNVKEITNTKGSKRLTIEYDDLARLHKETSIPLNELNIKILSYINKSK